MEKFYQYIDASLPDDGRNKLLYKFKRKTVDEMTQRANELTSRGLKDKDVISDLIISEYDHLDAKYREFANAELEIEHRKKMALVNTVGSIAYLFILIVGFIGLSITTHKWDTTWVMIADGVLIWVCYILTIGVNRLLDMKRVFRLIARALLAMDIVIMSVVMFLFMLGILHIPNCWVTIFFGLLLMFVGDGLFVSLTKQKLAIFYWLAYIPAISAMLYVILGGLSIVSWQTGWLMVPLSLLVDVLVIIIKINSNSSYDEEVVDAWKEN